jgi:hypothetical protein
MGGKDKEKNQLLAGVCGLNLDDDDEDEKEREFKSNNRDTKHQGRQLSPTKASKVAQEQEKEDGMQRSIAKLDPETKAKVNIMLNPDTPMKERLGIEIKLMKHPDPEVRQIISDIRYRIDNQSFLVQKLSTQQEVDDQMAKNLSQEAIRAAEEKKDLEGKKRQKLEEKRAEKRREKELEAEVRTHQAKIIAEDAGRLRQEVEQMNVAAQENKKSKIKQEEEIEQAVHEFHETEGKHLTHTERVLKEALIRQREIDSEE